MARSTVICNMAISHLGIGKEIADVDTEQSEEAKTCRRFYDTALRTLFRDFAWPFATQVQALALIETSPNNEWGYSYAYPTDCARMNKIQSGMNPDTHQSRVPFRVANNGSQRVIYTNEPLAIGEFTMLTEDSDLYPGDFELAFSFLLSALIAPRLTKGDPFKSKNEAFNMYYQLISSARANSINEEQPHNYPDSELIRSRE